jgi:tRNA A37 N6-isopentenylltransferase MiaA
MMSIGFDSDDIILAKLREKLRRMTDEELIEFGKNVRKLAENPFQRQLDEARAEWKRRKKRPVSTGKTSPYAKSAVQKFP